MNFKLVLRTYSQLRQLSDDERAKLEWLMGLSDTERELLAETLGPPVKAKASKAKTKHFQKCGTCGIGRRAAHHRDVNHRDYHEFDEGGQGGATEQKKSKRASGMAAAIHDSLQRGRQAAAIPTLCTYEIDGKVCKGTVNDGIHDKSMGYGGYHEFQPESQAVAASGD